MRLFFLLFVLIFSFTKAQNQIFLYEYISIPDSLHKDQKMKEIMVLNVEKDRSEFYNLEQFQADSTDLSDLNKGGTLPPASKRPGNNDRIIKRPPSKEIEFISLLGYMEYRVKQPIDLKWKIQPEFSRILGCEVQKASTDFGGRKWIAWFSKDIPIQNGPYKFGGLPGLIFKIADAQNYHTFELKGIENTDQNFVYPELHVFPVVKLNEQKYAKVFKKYRKNPVADLVGKIPDYTDSNGNFSTGAELLRELEKTALEKLKKGNNVIEIDLLN